MPPAAQPVVIIPQMTETTLGAVLAMWIWFTILFVFIDSVSFRIVSGMLTITCMMLILTTSDPQHALWIVWFSVMAAPLYGIRAIFQNDRPY